MLYLLGAVVIFFSQNRVRRQLQSEGASISKVTLTMAVMNIIAVVLILIWLGNR